jgi:predicted nucleotidyltransferase component of viral defense system
VRYRSAFAFRQALEDRLRGEAEKSGSALVRLRKRVTFERLLARLLHVAPDRWVLKGALALDFRFPTSARATKDMDLARTDDDEAAAADFLEAQMLDLEDNFYFAIEKAGTTGEDGIATRYHVRAEVAGRLFEEVTVDVGFSDPLIGEPELLRCPGFLSFAEIPPLSVPAVSLEQHLAEKVHAYTRSFERGIPNTRVKDLVDVVLVASHACIAARSFGEALRGIFDSRGQQSLPTSFPSPPAEWPVPYRRLAADVGVTDDLTEAHRVASALVDPVLRGEAEGSWDPTEGEWGSCSGADGAGVGAMRIS